MQRHGVIYESKDMGLAPYGEYKRQARKIGVVKVLSPKRVQELQFLREDEATMLVEKIRNA